MKFFNCRRTLDIYSQGLLIRLNGPQEMGKDMEAARKFKEPEG